MNELLYKIPADTPREEIIRTLREHPEVRFVSLVGIDMAGNDTDEKIPVRIFIEDIDKFYDGTAVQTDGSSVVLPKIATINNAKVDLPIDPAVNWFVDYDQESPDTVGTLRIPSFIIHEGKRVDSRAALVDTLAYVKRELLDFFRANPEISGAPSLSGSDIVDIRFTSATELEFWVKTPLEDNASIEEMSASQVMNEQYWERTHGAVRTALEECLIELDKYGFHMEMGHKEVGGLKAQIDENGRMTHVCEQIEIDWQYDGAVQAADNELFVRTIVREVFRLHRLEVNFKAKPLIGLAGNGEHTHLSIAAVTADGKMHSLFAADDQNADYMSAIGYGALMGLLKNYEAINPFVSATNDSFNRLKPGFEAPVCVVTSFGHTPAIPSRNRTVLVSLIRDLKNPMATRFELRATNPYSNTYLVLAACYLAILDGIKHTAGRTAAQLLAELSKQPGEDAHYLERDRAYRSEEDVFEFYTPEERDARFGKPPATVWENMLGFDLYPEKVAVLTAGDTLRPQIIKSFRTGALLRWKIELISRIIPEYRDLVRRMKEIKSDFVTDQDAYMWNKIHDLRIYLAKDTIDDKALFSLLIKALNEGDYRVASALQFEMNAKIEELKELYDCYKKNMI
ncbi:glutamine synthetase [Selenomonas artemidis]|uniref:glutamine synthetase n=1 Tax=Selenomonas artemidis TaxID=671224 RepID=UPI00288B4842|nr:glutamine synthetase [Selenomonas artemidis]